MSDVFISYATEDRECARMLAASLEDRGWSVWWDRKIVPGQSFDQVIERELETAKCVVVLWSESSINSEWVKNEAASAAERGALVPALIDNVKIPLEFRRKQTADLIGFKGDSSHSGFQALCGGISNVLPAGTTPPDVSPPSSSPRWNRIWVPGSIIAAVVALGLGIFLMSNEKSADQIPSKPVPPPAPTPWVEIYRTTHEGYRHKDCVPFSDLEAEVSKGPISRIDVYHGGYIHGIRIWYGSGIGSRHGYTEGINMTPWDVPKGERITRVEGAITGFYLSRLQFFTDKGLASPLFGGEPGKGFEVTAPSNGALMTIGGWADLTRHKAPSRHRAICGMTFHFGAPNPPP